jgi:chemotaxis protein CheD
LFLPISVTSDDNPSSTFLMFLKSQIEGRGQFMVGMADFAVSQDPAVSLRTSPLGACLAIAVYDPINKVGGLLHSLLPDSTIDPERAARRPGMFLDTGLAALFARLEELKVHKDNLQTSVAGGAQIMDDGNCFNIGQRNFDHLIELLAREGMKIDAQDVGGNTNCSMELFLATGEVRLKYSGQPIARTLCKSSMST